MKNEITIPERHVEFCREIARLCEKYELNSCSGRFDPGWMDDWRETIEFSWSSGRHNAEVNQIRISSTKNITVKTRSDLYSPEIVEDDS